MTSNDTRNHIIHTGADLIGQKGFGATGINAVLTAAGVPKGSFYITLAARTISGWLSSTPLRRNTTPSWI